MPRSLRNLIFRYSSAICQSNPRARETKVLGSQLFTTFALSVFEAIDERYSMESLIVHVVVGLSLISL